MLLFERSEFLIPTWVTPQYRATSKKYICACVRPILVSVGGRQTAIVVARYDSMIPGTYYVPDTYVPHFMIPGTYYVPDTYDTRYVLCTRYVCTTLAVVLLIVQLYRYLFVRQWVVVRMIPTFRPRNSCIAICLFVSGWWYHTNVPPVDTHV